MQMLRDIENKIPLYSSIPYYREKLRQVQEHEISN
jgi:hypothetical protein